MNVRVIKALDPSTLYPPKICFVPHVEHSAAFAAPWAYHPAGGVHELVVIQEPLSITKSSIDKYNYQQELSPRFEPRLLTITLL